MIRPTVTSDDIKLRHPTTIVVAGATKAGKSSLIFKLVKYRSHLFDVPQSRILYCYGIFDPSYLQLQKDVPGLELFQGIPVELFESPDPSTPTMVVLDDLIESTASSKLIAKLFMQTSHHANITVVLITQNLFYNGSQYRNIMKNASVIVLMTSIRDHLGIQTLSRQLFPKTPKYVYDSYEDAMKNKYGYLVLNLDPAVEPLLRVVKGIFPGEEYITYLPK